MNEHRKTKHTCLVSFLTRYYVLWHLYIAVYDDNDLKEGESKEGQQASPHQQR